LPQTIQGTSGTSGTISPPIPNNQADAAKHDVFYLKACVGLDLGDRVHHYCLISASGEVAEKGKIPNTREALSDFARKFSGLRIVLEAGAQSPWISHHLMNSGCGLEVVVANARKVELISKNTRKCDAHDAESLGRLGRADVHLLSPIQHRGQEAQRALASLRMRDSLVRQRKSQVNCVRGLLKSVGQEVPGADPATFAKKCRETLAGEPLHTVTPMLQVLDTMGQQIKALDKHVDTTIAEQYPDAARLMQINGVGPLTSLTFVLTVDDVGRFDRCRDIGAFLGLVPRRDQSGNTDRQLGITRQGNAFLRRLLVNCAQTILGPFGQDSDLRRQGLKKIEAFGEKQRNKAVLATARKLAVTMLSLLRSGKDWQALRDAPEPSSTEAPSPAMQATAIGMDHDQHETCDN
jgi:transposase